MSLHQFERCSIVAWWIPAYIWYIKITYWWSSLIGLPTVYIIPPNIYIYIYICCPAINIPAVAWVARNYSEGFERGRVKFVPHRGLHHTIPAPTICSYMPFIELETVLTVDTTTICHITIFVLFQWLGTKFGDPAPGAPLCYRRRRLARFISLVCVGWKKKTCGGRELLHDSYHSIIIVVVVVDARVILASTIV